MGLFVFSFHFVYSFIYISSTSLLSFSIHYFSHVFSFYLQHKNEIITKCGCKFFFYFKYSILCERPDIITVRWHLSVGNNVEEKYTEDNNNNLEENKPFPISVQMELQSYHKG